jgi:putative SOS response-associated peptidase YedK
MCGRYRLSRRKQIIEEHFDAVSGNEDWTPRYNIAPTPARADHSSASQGTAPRNVTSPLGLHSLMGERHVWLCADD